VVLFCAGDFSPLLGLLWYCWFFLCCWAFGAPPLLASFSTPTTKRRGGCALHFPCNCWWVSAVVLYSEATLSWWPARCFFLFLSDLLGFLSVLSSFKQHGSLFDCRVDAVLGFFDFWFHGREAFAVYRWAFVLPGLLCFDSLATLSGRFRWFFLSTGNPTIFACRAIAEPCNPCYAFVHRRCAPSTSFQATWWFMLGLGSLLSRVRLRIEVSGLWERERFRRCIPTL